jgi:hypothetical protein
MAEVRVLRRSLGGREAGGLRLIDSCRSADGRLRLFFGVGTKGAMFDGTPRLGVMRAEEAHEIGGAVMVVGRGEGPLALAAGGSFDHAPALAECDLFAGRKVILGSRLAETAEQIAEGLAHHARRFGVTGAVFHDRGTEVDPALGPALERALAAYEIEMVVVLLSSPLALGKAEPALTEVYMAPAAPGRGRMEAPAPAPFAANLAEPLTYELVKWRFLAEARAVACLDACDILPPGADPFAAALAGGVVALRGQLAYPWRIKAGRAAGFGDHVVRQFDAAFGVSRWVVAPRLAGLGRIWRLARVAEMPDEAESFGFWRAMGLRVPGAETSRLVPKTSVIEDEGLLALAAALGADPVRPPATALRPAAEKPPEALRTTIVTCMKNEGPFLLEWIAYHRVIGVDGFIVYTNDCTDGTDDFLSLLEAKGICQHRANPWAPGAPQSPQYTALEASESEPIVQEADWAVCMDVDEFIDIKIGAGHLSDLYRAAGSANLISMTWRLFGDSGVVAYRDAPIISQFTRCAPELIRKPHQAWGFKTLFRRIDLFRKFGVHRPKGLQPEHWEKIHWLNGSGRAMPQSMLRTGWRSTTATYGYDWVQLNHYAVRSAESFLVKRERGRVNHTDRDQGKNYWFRMSHNADEDRSILRMMPALAAEMDRLMADPEIAAAHDHSVAKHREKIAELRARPDQQAFLAELTGARMTNLTRRQRHFGSAVFNMGFTERPDEIALAPTLAPDFFFTVEQSGEAEH